MEGCDMDFSDIRTIIIGEAGEYGKRLVRYLEIHLSSAVRVYHFTTAEVDFTNLAGGTRLFLQI